MDERRYCPDGEEHEWRDLRDEGPMHFGVLCECIRCDRIGVPLGQAPEPLRDVLREALTGDSDA